MKIKISWFRNMFVVPQGGVHKMGMEGCGGCGKEKRSFCGDGRWAIGAARCIE